LTCSIPWAVQAWFAANSPDVVVLAAASWAGFAGPTALPRRLSCFENLKNPRTNVIENACGHGRAGCWFSSAQLI